MDEGQGLSDERITTRTYVANCRVNAVGAEHGTVDADVYDWVVREAVVDENK
jgi:hypothetical protein